MRIVSLLPSATEIICGLGLRDDLVGVSHECDFPHDVSALPKVTRSRIPNHLTGGEIDSLVREQLQNDNSLYALDREMMKSLRPDLIVTQALCDVCAVAEQEVLDVASDLPACPPVVNLKPQNLEGVFDCIEQVGRAAGCPDRAQSYAQLRGRVEAVADRSSQLKQRPRVVLLEWIDPPFSAGHWSPELVELAGGEELLGNAGQHFRTVAWQEIVDADPDVLFIACCGWDVDRTLKDLPVLRSSSGWDTLRSVRSGRVFVVDGSSYFNRPGPRLVESLELLAHAVAPEIHRLPTGLAPATAISADESTFR